MTLSELSVYTDIIFMSERKTALHVFANGEIEDNNSSEYLCRFYDVPEGSEHFTGFNLFYLNNNRITKNETDAQRG